MEHKFINNILEEYTNWGLQVFDKRYGKGFYCMILPQRFINDIWDILTGGDMEVVSLEEYLWDMGNWLPIVSVRSTSAIDALNELETKISTWSVKDNWADRVEDTIESIIDSNDGNYGIDVAIRLDKDDIFIWKDK